MSELPDGKWGRPCNGAPSTHIIKLSDGRHEGLLAAEHACMGLARAVGLTTVSTDLADFDGIRALIIERYDRARDPRSGDVRRLHQEDACQALGIDIDANRGRGKYERFGGPSFARIASLLDRHGDATIEIPKLLRALVFTVAIGNADAHGKNLSFLIDTDTGAVTLAPFYDTVPTVLWPKLRDSPAMAIGGAFGWPSLDAVIAEARSWGLGVPAAAATVSAVIAELRQAVSACENARVAELVDTRLDGLTT